MSIIILFFVHTQQILCTNCNLEDEKNFIYEKIRFESWISQLEIPENINWSKVHDVIYKLSYNLLLFLSFFGETSYNLL